MKILHTVNNKNYTITEKRGFEGGNFFLDRQIKKVFDFAYDMSFGKVGEHRSYRSGGSKRRKNGEIFINTFQGKLSEIAIQYVFLNHNPSVQKQLSKVDYDVYGLGDWDDVDVQLGKLKFSIKSTKFIGNLLLLECKDWLPDGSYMPNSDKNKSSIYDYFVLVRIKPIGEVLLKDERLLYSNEVDKDELFSIINSTKWEYDIAGYITNNDLKDIIKNKHIIQKGDLLHNTLMDADNYYVQSGDMSDFTSLVKSL